LTGREASLKRCLDAYEATLADIEYEVILEVDQPTWTRGCNQGAARAQGDILHFTADDLEPQPGCWPEALALLERDELPAPRVFNYSMDGTQDNAEDGPDGAVTWFTRIPLMRRDQYDRVGVWPEVDYCSDMWVSEKARSIGIETRMVWSYTFVHHWEQVGRAADMDEAMGQGARALEKLRKEFA
jgi:GT2 family glycosyltransferase